METITRFRKECKLLAAKYGKDVFLTATVVLTGFLGFGLGRLSKIVESKVPVTFHDVTESPAGRSKDEVPKAGVREQKIGDISASKNGTRYYLQGCSNRISEKNRILFSSEASAISAGYTKAANCK